VFRYRSVDVAIVVRSGDGRLYTPVIRGADRADVAAIATASQAATLAVMRHTIKQEDLEGACFTVSHVPVEGTMRVVAIPNDGQSAVLGISAERTSVAFENGAAVAVPVVTLTLTYDHTLCDGVYAANFLAAVAAGLETSPA
jgi:pyruvate dehydrogenase E2 component (dihydrolipoamide acetyltransferase)